MIRLLLCRTALAATATAAMLALGACGDNDTADVAHSVTSASAPTATATGKHDQADVTFAQQMIMHHLQAIAMADMAERRTSSQDVKALAAKIKKEQRPEIKTMSRWLKSWGERVPRGMDTHRMGQGSPSAMPSMPGMMSDQQMREMTRTSGKTFDTMFLTMMIKHHQGAIHMAETEQKQGAYGPAKTLAGDIVTVQTAEITKTRRMLKDRR